MSEESNATPRRSEKGSSAITLTAWSRCYSSRACRGHNDDSTPGTLLTHGATSCEEHMPIAFDTNVAAAWQTRLTNGYNAIPLMVQTCVQRMTAGTIDWPLYKTWFDPQGNTNPANVQFVRTVFTTLGQGRQSKTLRFFGATGNAIEASAPGVWAYVWLLPAHGLATGVAHVGSGVRIAITQGMVAPTWTDRDVGAIICHELVHKLG